MRPSFICRQYVQRKFSHVLGAGFVLFGCSGQHEQTACQADASCRAQAGTSSSSAGFGNSAGNGSPRGGATGDASAGSAGTGLANQAGGSAGDWGNSAGAGAIAGGAGTNGGAAGALAGTGGAQPKVCPDGTFDHDHDPSTACKGWSRCTAGQFIAQDGTDTTDRVCAVCGAGSFSNSSNARMCSPWTDCAANSYVLQAGSATNNQRCAPCPTTLPDNQSFCFPAGACLSPGSCQPGTVQVTPASGTTPAKCNACVPGDYCIGGQTPEMRCNNGTWDHDGDPATCCSDWTVCAAGQYVSRAGSATIDRGCTSCAAGTFSASTNSPTCSPWKECAPASSVWPQGGVATAGTAAADTVCADAYYRFDAATAGGAYAVTVDSAGNVYVAGGTKGAFGGPNGGTSDVFVRKFDAKGGTLWTKQFGTSADDQATGVAVDATGNVYVTGPTYGALEGASAGSSDGFLRKLDASGTTLWTRQFGTVGPETPKSLVLDSSGNAYIAGSTYPTGGQGSGDPFVRKFDASGATVWAKQFGGADEDEAMAVAVDGSGNVYVGGYTSDLIPASSQGQRDAFVRKLDSTGATVWTRQFGTSENDFVYAMRVDGDGNLYAGGSTGALLGSASAGGDDGFLRKFDKNGTALWTQQFGTPTSDSSYALGVDGSNNVYAVGSTMGVLSGSNAGGNDIFVRKLDPSGSVLWTKQIGTANDDTALGAVADALGNVFVVGYAYESASFSATAFALYVSGQSP
ncbi:MAG TPA: SBBP repeat-containing protein [Polyangiaceae bacterium]|nr:SBBP repeat-containing protein [Polyangiaceae bacterium]